MGALKSFERIVIVSLVGMVVVVVILAAVELAWIIVQDVISAPAILLEIDELLETIKAYLVENVTHVEIVLEVALIAIARKVIILDLEKYDGLTLVGMAGLILAVAVAFFMVRHHRTGLAGREDAGASAARGA